MTDHLEAPALRAFAAGTLRPRELQAIDTHLAACAGCRAALSAIAGSPADLTTAKRLVRAIERAGPHLPYAQMEALVDGRLGAANRNEVQSHLAACPRCAREVSEMRAFAPALSQRLRPAKAPSPGFFASLRDWFGGATAMRAVTASLVAAVAAVAVLSDRTGPVGGAGGNDGIRASTSVATTPPMPAGPGTGGATAGASSYDRGVFDHLGKIAPEAEAAWRKEDFESVAKLLRVRADRGQTPAKNALALLLAEGQGVPVDRDAALRLWTAAAAANEPGAAHILAILRQAMAQGSYSR